MTLLFELVVESLGVGGVAALTGAIILGERAEAAASHPLLAATVCGLMTGLGLLVILPDTIEELVHEAGWPVERVMLVFLSSILVLFCIDHCFLEHQHLPPAGSSMAPATETALTPAECPATETALNVVAVAEVDPEAARASDAAQACEPCEPCEPCDETDDSSRRNSLWTSGRLSRVASAQRTSTTAQQLPVPQSTRECECENCDRVDAFALFSFAPRLAAAKQQRKAASRPKGVLLESGPLSDAVLVEMPSTTPGASEGRASRVSVSGGHSPVAAPPPQPSRVSRLLAVALRMMAWMLHAMIDGMLLAGAASLPVLLITALPVSICAIQDVAAFTVSMTKSGCSKRQLVLGLGLFSLSFPLGGIGAYLLFAESGSDVFVHVIRCIVAGIFVYMAAFELAPPHSHNRYVNAMYAIAFAVGASCALSIELIEEATSGETAAT